MLANMLNKEGCRQKYGWPWKETDDPELWWPWHCFILTKNLTLMSRQFSNNPSKLLSEKKKKKKQPCRASLLYYIHTGFAVPGMVVTVIAATAWIIFRLGCWGHGPSPILAPSRVLGRLLLALADVLLEANALVSEPVTHLDGGRRAAITVSVQWALALHKQCRGWGGFPLLPPPPNGQHRLQIAKTLKSEDHQHAPPPLYSKNTDMQLTSIMPTSASWPALHMNRPYI